MGWVILLAITHLASTWFITTRLLRPGRLSDFAVEWLLTAITTFYGLPIIIGWLTGYLNSYTLLISAGISLAGGTIACIKAAQPQPYLRQIFGQVSRIPPGSLLLGLVIIMLLTILFCLGALLPVRYGDAVGYHIAGPMRWLQTGRFILESFGDPARHNYFAQMETFPNVKGILPFAVMLWSKNTSGTALVQWPYLCLLVFALYALLRRLQVPHTLTFTGILLCITAPEVLLQSLESYADVVFLAATATTVWIILKTVQDGNSWTAMVIAAFAFAQLAGSKSTGLYTSGLLGLFYLGAVAWRPGNFSGIMPRTRSVVLALALVTAVCLAIAGRWYLHAVINYANPIFPVKVSVLGMEVFSGYVNPNINSEMLEVYTKRKGWEAWWSNVSEYWRPPTLAPWNGGLGAAFFITGLPCVLLLLIILPFLKKPPGFLYVVVMLLAVALTVPAPMIARFALPYLAVAALAFCTVALYVTLPVRLLLTGFVLGLCGYNLYITAPSVLHRPRPVEVLLYNIASGRTRAAIFGRYADEYSAVDYWHDKVSSPSHKIAAGSAVSVWHLFDPSTMPDILNIHEVPGEGIDGWIARATQAGATHAFFSRTSPLYADAHKQPLALKLLYDYNHIRGFSSREKTMSLPLHGALFQVVK